MHMLAAASALTANKARRVVARARLDLSWGDGVMASERKSERGRNSEGKREREREKERGRVAGIQFAGILISRAFLIF